ncbi:helix-turn-helix transcriptional regulator [Streptomyces sp. NPDC055506]
MHDPLPLTEHNETFGPWLGRQLRRSGMSQADLADQVGTTRATVSAWITGRAEPHDETRALIADVLITAQPS